MTVSSVAFVCSEMDACVSSSREAVSLTSSGLERGVAGVLELTTTSCCAGYPTLSSCCDTSIFALRSVLAAATETTSSCSEAVVKSPVSPFTVTLREGAIAGSDSAPCRLTVSVCGTTTASPADVAETVVGSAAVSDTTAAVPATGCRLTEDGLWTSASADGPRDTLVRGATAVFERVEVTSETAPKDHIESIIRSNNTGMK